MVTDLSRLTGVNIRAELHESPTNHWLPGRGTTNVLASYILRQVLLKFFNGDNTFKYLHYM